MSEHAQLCDLIADLINEQKATTAAVTQLAESLAGIRTQAKAAKTETDKAIDKAKEPAAPAPCVAHAVESAKDEAATPGAHAPMDYKRDVAPTMAKLLADKGAPAVVALLSQFGVKKGAELPADKLAAALAAAKSALES
jgi:hypothetical protein